MWRRGIKVTSKEYRKCLHDYEMAMTTANRLLELKILNDADLKLIETKMAEKHGIKLNSLFRQLT